MYNKIVSKIQNESHGFKYKKCLHWNVTTWIYVTSKVKVGFSRVYNLQQTMFSYTRYIFCYMVYSTQHDKMLTDYQLQNNCDFTNISDTDKLKTSSKYQC